MAIGRGLRERDDIALTMVARRGDEERWSSAGAGAARVVGVVPTSRPARLAFEQVRFPRVLDELGVEVHHAPHYTMPARAPVPCVVTIHDCTFFDHPNGTCDPRRSSSAGRSGMRRCTRVHSSV